MRYIKWILVIVGIILLFIAGLQLYAFLFDVLYMDKRDDIKLICQEAIDESPIIYYKDGSGLPQEVGED